MPQLNLVEFLNDAMNAEKNLSETHIVGEGVEFQMSGCILRVTHY